MSHAIGRARVTAPGTIYTPDTMSDATIGLFRAMASWTSTYPAPAVDPAPVSRPRRPVEPQTDRARQAYAALTAPGTKFSKLPTIAAAFGTTTRELVELAIEHADRNPGSPVHADRTAAACPVWCAEQHNAFDVAAGYGLSHETLPTELVGDDPAYLETPATAAAWVERTDDAPGVGTPPRVVLALTDGTEGHYPGSEGVQGWSGSVEQVEQLGRSLLALAAIVRGEQAAATVAATVPNYRIDVYGADDVLLSSRDWSCDDDADALHTARRDVLDELGGAVMAVVFATGPSGVLVYVDTVTR